MGWFWCSWGFRVHEEQFDIILDLTTKINVCYGGAMGRPYGHELKLMGWSFESWVHVSMRAWVHVSMGAWVHESLSAWEHECMRAWEHECMSAWEHVMIMWIYLKHFGSALAHLAIIRTSSASPCWQLSFSLHWWLHQVGGCMGHQFSGIQWGNYET